MVDHVCQCFSGFRGISWQSNSPGVRADRFTKGEQDDGSAAQEIKSLIEISANYHVFQGTEGLLLQRDGDLNVDYVGLKKLSTFQIATKTFLRRKFGALFKPEIKGEGLQTTGEFGPGVKMVSPRNLYKSRLARGRDRSIKLLGPISRK